jgi:hypothetical protein
VILNLYSIFSNSGHVGWCTASPDTILKLDTLVMIQAKFGFNWSSSFRGEDFWKSLRRTTHSKIYLPCNFEVNLITHLGVIAKLNMFSVYTQHLSLIVFESHVGWCTASPDTILILDTLVMIQAKFGFHWSSTFRGEDFWKSLRRTPSDGNSSPDPLGQLTYPAILK